MGVTQRTRKLVIEATMDSKGVVTGAKKVETTTEKMGKSVSKASRGIRTAMGVVAAGAVVAFGKEMAQHGAQMDAINARTEKIFGSSAGAINRWAQDSASAFGMSAVEVKNLANNLGDLLIPLGMSREEAKKFTVETLNAANALSEWTGGQITVEQASEAVTKAMLGEREMLKSLGIKISEADVKARLAAKGQAQLTGDALAAAKAVATQELILTKSKDALDAYAEGGNAALQAQKELASQTATLKDDLAKTLQPALQTAVSGLGDMTAGVQSLVDWFDDLDDTGKKIAITIAGVSAALAMTYANPVLTGLALLAGALVIAGKAAKESEGRIKEMADAIAELGDNALNSRLSDLVAESETLSDAMDYLGVSVDDVKTHMLEGEDAYNSWVDSLNEGTDDVVRGSEVAEILRGETEKLAKAYWGAVKATNAQTAELDEGDRAFAESARELAAFRMAQGRARNGVEETTRSVKELADEMKALTDPVFAAERATDRFTESLRQAREDGVLTQQEIEDVTAAYVDMNTANAALTSENVEAFGAAAQEALGLTAQAARDAEAGLSSLGHIDSGSGFDALEGLVSRLESVSGRKITIDLAGLRMASRAEIEQAVTRALWGAMRTGSIGNVYL